MLCPVCQKKLKKIDNCYKCDKTIRKCTNCHSPYGPNEIGDCVLCREGEQYWKDGICYNNSIVGCINQLDENICIKCSNNKFLSTLLLFCSIKKPSLLFAIDYRIFSEKTQEFIAKPTRCLAIGHLHQGLRPNNFSTDLSTHYSHLPTKLD